MSRQHGEGQRSVGATSRGFGPRGAVLILLPCLALVLVGVLVLAGGAGALTYTEGALEAGIEFRLAGEIHDPDEEDNAWPAFPEIMGSGACWADLDGDGYDDLYIVNQQYNPRNPYVGDWADEVDPRNHLYINQGDGTFEETAEEAGVASRAFGHGCSAADYDGDGDVDLFVANFGMNELFENHGNATFSNVTAQAGVGDTWCLFAHKCHSTSSSWADYDLDGDLDLYVGNYVNTSLVDGARGPESHKGQENKLYRNEGDGTFTEVGRAAGVAGNPTVEQGSKTLGVVWLDIDRDGDLDLYAANDGVPNDLYRNEGDGTFIEISDESGLADQRAGMGVTAGDYDADGFPDLYFTHYASEHNGFYRNLGDGTFEDRSGEDGLAEDLDHVGWGTAFQDLDRDGDLDIVAVNGHTEWLAGGATDGGYAQATLFFRQDIDPAAPRWDPVWTNITDEVGLGPEDAKVSRGAAFSDPDLDGDTDILVVNNNNDTVQLFKASEVDGHSLTITLAQPGPNPQAIGGIVEVTTPTGAQVHTVGAGGSYLSQSSLQLGIGLGDQATAERIVVTWPDAATTTYTDVAAGQVIRLERDPARVVTDTIAPVTEPTVTGDGDLAGWFNSAVDLSLTATDRGITETSGVAETLVQLDQGAWTTYNGEVITRQEEGRHAISVRSSDQAGNTEPITTYTVRIDTTPPVTDHTVEGEEGENGWFRTANVTLTATDAMSGVDRILHRQDGGAWEVYDGPVGLTSQGTHLIEYRALDVAGNPSPLQAVEVSIDGTGPEVDLKHPGQGTVLVAGDTVATTGTGPAVVLATPGSTVRVQAEAQDATSGVDRVLFLLDGEIEHVDRTSPAWTWTWEAGTTPPGDHELVVVAIDGAGNANATGLDVVLLSPMAGATSSPTLPPAALLPVALGTLILPARPALRAMFRWDDLRA